MIIEPMPWREVETGDMVIAPDGSVVVAPGPWPGDGTAQVVRVSEEEAAAALRAAGFTWEVLDVA